VKTAAIVIVGDEILSGKVDDENARYLIGELRALGVRLGRIAVVPDEVDVIAETVHELASRFDWVFTSGGVGPTHDDLTVAGVARGLLRRVVRDPALEALLRAHFGADVPDAALRMADVPEGAERAAESELSWPVCVVDNVIVLPGVPEIFRRKFAAIRERFRDTPFVLRSVFLRADESRIAAALAEVAAEHPAVHIGSYPRTDERGAIVRVTLEGKDAGEVARATARVVAGAPPGSVERTD
jgi:molybdenum cofactor synthesis domain-containing protein